MFHITLSKGHLLSKTLTVIVYEIVKKGIKLLNIDPGQRQGEK